MNKTLRIIRTISAILTVFTALAVNAFSNEEVWIGIGNDYYWSTNLNWNGAFGMQANDDLTFPDEICGLFNCTTAFRRTNFNDYPVNTNFGQIEFSGSRYSILGNQIVLSGGFLTYGSNNDFSPNIVIGASQTWDGSGELELEGVVNLNGRILTLDGGNFTFDGSVHGTGGGRVNIRSGDIVINSDTEFSGFTSLNGGSLLLNGTLGGPLSQDGGRLEGAGTINANATNSFSYLDAGTISPGDGLESIGTLSIIGETQLNRQEGPTLEINLELIAKTTASDRIIVTNGNFQINGADLDVVFSIPPPAGKSFVVLQQSGTGNIIGQFDQGTAFVKDNVLFFVNYFPDRVVIVSQGIVGP